MHEQSDDMIASRFDNVEIDRHDEMLDRTNPAHVLYYSMFAEPIQFYGICSIENKIFLRDANKTLDPI